MSSSGQGSSDYDGSPSNSVSHQDIELQQKPKKEYKMEGSTVTYYDNIIGDFKQNEAYTLGKLERMKKEADSKKKQKSGSAMADAVQKTEDIRKWEEHMWKNPVLCEKLATHRTKGLTAAQVTKSREENGTNVLTEKDALPWYVVFIKEMTGFFSLLLWFGSALCFLGYGIQEDKSEDQSNLYLGIVLALVTFVTGVFSYMQTSKAASLMDDFKGFIPKTANVRRDDADVTIPAQDVVVGDFIYVNAGSSVPADVVLFTSKEMKVNNASLTGESDDLLRVVNQEGGTDCANIFEAPNVAFFGTQCTEGSGTGIVIKTGDNSVIGLIASLSQSAEKKETPLSMEIERFILLISAVAITLGVVFFLFGVAYGYDYITNLVFAIGIIVANVPEGLLATVTVSLALTAQRMAKKNVLVKNLESVETLGSTSCICSDKTGTLTQNKMTLSGMFVDRKAINCDVNMQIFNQEMAIAKPQGEDAVKQVKKPAYDLDQVGFQIMCNTIALSTVAKFEYVPDVQVLKKNYAKANKIKLENLTKPEDWGTRATKEEKEGIEKEAKILQEKENAKNWNDQATKGDASETGLIKFVQPLFLSAENKHEAFYTKGIEAYRAEYPVLQNAAGNNEPYKIDFSSQIKFNACIRDMNKNVPNPKTKEDNLCVFIKGAPDRIWTRCTTILVDGKPMPLTKDVLSELEEANDKFGNKGERVLGFSRLYLDPIRENNYFNKSKLYDVKEWGKFTTLDEIPSNGDFPGYFPMQGLEFVGLCALNDPPRKGVDMSVLKCRAAGIKVIMVTGDQKNTGAAIAAKVNIISDVEREYNFLKKANPEWTEEELMAQSNAIVVHGDELAAVNFKEEGYDDAEIEKGRKVLDWISIKEVVFARTTPSQKLLIVDACQRKGHVVAVTGDGVNDSPAIKKADIGVAMGCGSEVAQNAGDMILLDDNFSSIVNGVEEGRLIFDNLKKSIAYTLSSNIPEISPFLFFIIFQVPLPLSTVLILCIDLGTDMVPAISFAYENPELDIMERYPRNSKRDHLVNSKLISFAYLQIGIVQASAGFFTYFYILNDYGIRPGTTFALALEPGYIPRPQDRYDPYQSEPVPCYAYDEATGEYQTDANGEHIPIEGATSKYGNCNYGNEAFETVLNWNGNKHNAVDMRLFYTDRQPESWSVCRWTTGVNGLDFYNQSFVSGAQVCYTTEGLRFAQAGYLVSIVCVQWGDLMICKTRALSISQQGMVNNNSNFALFFETALVAILCYVPQLGVPLGTRQIAFPHFAVPSFSFFAVIMAYDELRKIFLRRGIRKSKRGRASYVGWVVRNTYY